MSVCLSVTVSQPVFVFEQWWSCRCVFVRPCECAHAPATVRSGHVLNRRVGLLHGVLARQVPQSQLPVLCPGGTYNPTTGNSTVDACRGCPAGSYCPMGSSQFIPCGNASVYCPVNSSAPLVVDDGRYSVPSNGNASSQAVCEPGSYCIAGVKRPCAGGTWSNEVSARPDRSCGWAIPAVYQRCDVACGHVDGVLWFSGSCGMCGVEAGVVVLSISTVCCRATVAGV